ncbi:MAG TPA: hypothetical protein PLX08_00480 [Bacteroidales bacterium]|nr:hypothetical protein [Bacteroidales bacterium]
MPANPVLEKELLLTARITEETSQRRKRRCAYLSVFIIAVFRKTAFVKRLNQERIISVSDQRHTLKGQKSILIEYIYCLKVYTDTYVADKQITDFRFADSRMYRLPIVQTERFFL